MMQSGGYRNFADYASANNPRESYIMNVQELLSQERGLSGGSSRFLDSDSDSDYEFSDARSHLGEQHALEARYGRNQIIYLSEPTPGEYLHQAFELAAECKSQLNKHSLDLAVAAVVKACALSTFSLSVINPESEECAKFMQDVENTFRSPHTSTGSVFWAAKCILIGFGLLSTPKRFEMTFNSLSLHHNFYQLPMQLTPEEVFWVAHLGRFRAHLSALKDSEPAVREDLAGMSLARYPEVSSSLLKATKHDVEVMIKFRPKHPLTIQSARLLAQFLQKPEVPLRMMEGALEAMHQYSDPAQAVQHLLHCMYSELMACYGRPKPDVQKDLIEAAEGVLEGVRILKGLRFSDMRDVNLWDLTMDKLLSCMFVLARTFPLQEALDGHELAAFIEDLHQEWRQQPSGPNSKVWQLFCVDRPASPVNSFSTDAKLTDDDSAPIHQCGRCTRVRKEVSRSAPGLLGMQQDILPCFSWCR
ncbi:hypothetical protein ABBQ32_007547 [Trebouxia sp. C0010 RCD-2024]